MFNREAARIRRDGIVSGDKDAQGLLRRDSQPRMRDRQIVCYKYRLQKQAASPINIEAK